MLGTYMATKIYDRIYERYESPSIFVLEISVIKVSRRQYTRLVKNSFAAGDAGPEERQIAWKLLYSAVIGAGIILSKLLLESISGGE